ncbi:MAG: WD40/YVTN/BNR-like repeat-containing protein [Acidobacteriota bacterium]
MESKFFNPRHWRGRTPVRLLSQVFFFLFLLPISVMAHQPHDPIGALAVSPNFANDKTIFAATTEVSTTLGVRLFLKSTDAGVTWGVMSFPNTLVTAIAVSPDFANDQTLFAGTAGRGVLLSTDGGVSWQPGAADSLRGVSSLALSPAFAQDDTLFAVGTFDTLFQSTDRGLSWTLVSDFTVYSSDPIRTLAASPNYTQDDTLYLGTNGSGVFKSTDGAATWTPMISGLTNQKVLVLRPSPAYLIDRSLFAGTFGGGVFVSVDGGPWVARNDGMTELKVTDLNVVKVGILQDLTLFATTVSGVFRSTDGGSLWTPTGSISRPLSPQDDLHFFFVVASPDYASDQSVFLAMLEGLWRSRDGGDNWIYSDTLPNRISRGLALSPDYQNDGTLAMVSYGGGVVKSTDRGVSWRTKNTGLDNTYSYSLELSPDFARDQTAVTGIYFGLEITTNGGETWTSRRILGQSLNVRALAFSPAFALDRTLWAGTNQATTDLFQWQFGLLSSNGVWRSTDGGDSWIPTKLNGAHVFSLAVSPDFEVDRTVFAGVGDSSSFADAGVYKSVDGGINWTRLDTSAFDSQIEVVAVSPDYGVDQVVFAGSLNGGVIKSLNGGQTWTQNPLTQGWAVMDLVLSPDFANDRELYVATLGHGLRKGTFAGIIWTQVPLDAVYVTRVGLSASFAQDGTLVAASYDGLFKSEDRGATWQQLYPVIRAEDTNNPRVVFSPNWQKTLIPEVSGEGFHSSSTAGATAGLDSVLSRVAWVGARGPDQGKADVYIDGVFQKTVDLYDPTLSWQRLLYISPALPVDFHTVRVVVRHEKNPLSTGYDVSVDAFDVTTAPGPP